MRKYYRESRIFYFFQITDQPLKDVYKQTFIPWTPQITDRFCNTSIQKSSFQLDIKLLLIVSYCCCNITTNMVAYINANLLSYSSRGRKSKMGLTELKSRCQRSCVLSWRPTSCLFWLLGTTHIPWLLAHSILKATNGQLSCSHTASL